MSPTAAGHQLCPNRLSIPPLILLMLLPPTRCPTQAACVRVVVCVQQGRKFHGVLLLLVLAQAACTVAMKGAALLTSMHINLQQSRQGGDVAWCCDVCPMWLLASCGSTTTRC